MRPVVRTRKCFAACVCDARRATTRRTQPLVGLAADDSEARRRVDASTRRAKRVRKPPPFAVKGRHGSRKVSFEPLPLAVPRAPLLCLLLLFVARSTVFGRTRRRATPPPRPHSRARAFRSPGTPSKPACCSRCTSLPWRAARCACGAPRRVSRVASPGEGCGFAGPLATTRSSLAAPPPQAGQVRAP